MNTIKLFHGTNAINVKSVMDSPKASNSINGLGFCVTTDVEVAKLYGSKVVCWEVEASFLDKFDSIVRPIDTRYVEGLRTYEECAKDGIEIMLTQVSADVMATYCEDAYVI